MNKFLVGSILCLVSFGAHAMDPTGTHTMDSSQSPSEYEIKVASFRLKIQKKVGRHARSGSHGPSEVAHLLTSLRTLETLAQAETALKNKIGNKGAQAWLEKRKKTYETTPGWEGAWLYQMIALLAEDPTTFLETIKQPLPKPQLRRHRSLLFDLYTDPKNNIKAWQSVPAPVLAKLLDGSKSLSQKNHAKSASLSADIN